MRNTRDGEVIRESNASTCVFHSRDRRTSSFAATKIKEKRDECSSSLLARPEMVNTRVPCNLQWRSTRRGCRKIRWYGEEEDWGDIKSATKKGENETVVTMSLYYVHGWTFSRGLLLGDSNEERKRKTRERERKKRNNGIEMYLDLASGFT